MATRDRNKTLRNKEIKRLTSELDQLLNQVLGETGYESQSQLHGKIGSKNAEFIDIKQAVIYTGKEYYQHWIVGFKKKLEELNDQGFIESSPYYDLYLKLKLSPSFRKYVEIFFERTFLNYYDSLIKYKPEISEAEIYFGSNGDDFGLLVTPRFKLGKWENDKSEIRHFPAPYWSLKHVLITGLVYPEKEQVKRFSNIDDILAFLEDAARRSRSPHQVAFVDNYMDYVRKSENPENIPFIIPELRYNGREYFHEYRLDYTILSSDGTSKVGIELSPWSTHGQLATKDKTGIEINKKAKANFENEISKQIKYFQKFKITVLIFSDSELVSSKKVFSSISKYLVYSSNGHQIKLHELDSFFDQF